MKRCERKSYAELSERGKIMKSWGYKAIAIGLLGLVIIVSTVIAAIRLTYDADETANARPIVEELSTEQVFYHKEFKEYKIEFGDTLWDIAEKYAGDMYNHGDYVREVIELNQLENEDHICFGDVITIPYFVEDVVKDESIN